jgi:hypothetical protein
MSFLALLKVRSHSVTIAGIDRVSKAHKQRVPYTDRLLFHYSIGLKACSDEISLGIALPYWVKGASDYDIVPEHCSPISVFCNPASLTSH